VHVTSCNFSGNQALGGASFDSIGGSAGGAIDNFGASPLTQTTLTVLDSTFTNNRAVSADGPYFAAGGALDNNAGVTNDKPSLASVTDCLFVGNLARGGNNGGTANGGAVSNFGATMTLTNSKVIANKAVGGDGGNGVNSLSQALGGGIISGVGATITVSGCIVVGNQAIGGNNATITDANPNTGGAVGGGIENVVGTLTVTGCLIAGNVAHGGNTASGPGGNALGGGIQDAVFATMTVTNSSILGNLAIAGQGGAGASSVPAGLAAGGGIDISFVSSATITGSTISGNAAIGGGGGPGNKGGHGLGGGISVGFNALLDPTGAKGFPEGSSLTLIDSTVSLNRALGGIGGTSANGGDGLGGGLFLYSRSTVSPEASATLTNSTIELNSAVGGHQGVGGSDGEGIGGGIYNFQGMLTIDLFSFVKMNHASTSNDNLFP
jgi:hypothetical protein